jgi:anti-sigma28 factor (negative regulator of flagellin synthesis)
MRLVPPVDAESRSEHVRRIAEAVRSGAYRVDLRTLAERIVEKEGWPLRLPPCKS